MYQLINDNCGKFVSAFASIDESRRQLLQPVSDYVFEKIKSKSEINLNFICTHNSRRSVLAQVWAAVAAHYYGIENVSAFSGGTEITAVHPNIIATLKRHGLKISESGLQDNPVYHISYSDKHNPLICFSKLYNDQTNPKLNFAAIMVCDSAAQNCPFVTGAEKRLPLSFEDPKSSDGTPEEAKTYDNACDAIALEMFHIFYLVKQKL